MLVLTHTSQLLCIPLQQYITLHSPTHPTHSTQNLNTVMPDLVTGGEALADLLRSEGCVLKSLKLGECYLCMHCARIF